jgi:hypothetical protein
MEKQLIITVPNVRGEEGLNIACREGKLFRNDEKLENLYKNGFRIYNYSIVKDKDSKGTQVKVFLKK